MSKERRLQCSSCSYSTPRAYRLSKHVKEMHGAKESHACDQCSHVSTRESNLEMHKKAVHLGIK